MLRRRHHLEKTLVDDKNYEFEDGQQKRKFVAQKIKKYLCYGTLTGFCLILCSILATDLLVESPIDAADYDISPSLPFSGPLTPNDHLVQADKILENEFYGPESLAYHEPSNTIFTGTRHGQVHRISLHENPPKIILSFRYLSVPDPSLCNATVASMLVCGRPLGMRISPFNPNQLVIIDAYHGLFEYNIENGTARLLLKTGTIPNSTSKEPPIRYLNDFDFTHDGKLVLSEPSYAYADHHFHYIILERSKKGRILLFDPTKNETSILIDKLVIPNGVQMDPTKKCVFIAEMGLYRILKHCFGHHDKGKYEVFLDGLPGFPDNIRVLPAQGFLSIPISMLRIAGESFMCKWTRNFIAKFISIVIDLDASPTKEYGLVLFVDLINGSIVESWHDAHAKNIASITQILAIEDTFYFANDGLMYIGRLKSYNKR